MDVVRCLITAGADVNAESNDGVRLDLEEILYFYSRFIYKLINKIIKGSLKS